VPVRHAGDELRDLVRFATAICECVEDAPDGRARSLVFGPGLRPEVHVLEHEAAQREHRAADFLALRDVALSRRGLDQIVDERVDPVRTGVAEHVDLRARQVAFLEDAVADRVVDVVIDVRNAIDDADDLALERLRLALAPVGEDAVAHLVRQVEALRNTERVLVVPEATAEPLGKRGVERLLARVSERRMAHVVSKADRLDEILVEAQGARDDAGDARRLERVRHPRAVVIADGIDEDLCLPLQPAKRFRVHDAVAVALKRRAKPAVVLVAEAPARVVGPDRERRERALLVGANARREFVRDPARYFRHPITLDDDRDGAAVAAPRRAGDVARTFGAEKDDHGGDFMRFGEPPERPSGADLREHLLARALLLVGKTALAEPRLRSRRAGRDGVAADAVLRVEIGDEARERQHRSLRDGVLGHAGRRPRAGGRRDVDDNALPLRLHRRQRDAQRAHSAHHVGLPGALPDVVDELVEAVDLGPADVVHEHVDAAESRQRRLHDTLRAAAFGEVRGDVQVADPFLAAPARDDPRALFAQLARGLEADPAGRAGDDAHLVLEAQVHPATLVVVATTLLLARHGETDWNRERRWQGHADTPLNEAGRDQARALAASLRRDPPVAVYSSDLARARETAEIVAQALRLPV